MTYLEMEMKELGRSSSNNTHNIPSLIHTPQVYHRRLAVGRSPHGGRVYTHTRARKQYRTKIKGELHKNDTVR